MSLVSQLQPCALMVAKSLCQPLGLFQGMFLRSTERILFTYEMMTVFRRCSAKRHANTTYEASKHIESTFLNSDYCKCSLVVKQGVRLILWFCASVQSVICGRFGDLFNGVGLLKEYELKLLVDDSVKPVAQLVRRIPYRLREKVNKKLD